MKFTDYYRLSKFKKVFNLKVVGSNPTPATKTIMLENKEYDVTGKTDLEPRLYKEVICWSTSIGRRPDL